MSAGARYWLFVDAAIAAERAGVREIGLRYLLAADAVIPPRFPGV